MVSMNNPDMSDPIILASSSPRRIDLFRQLGIEFQAVPCGVEEMWDSDISIGELVEGNALLKARDVAARRRTGLIVGADTVVACEGEIFGKPSDMEDARRILRRLAGKTHQVYSGIAVVRADDDLSKTAHAVTDVTFRTLSESQLTRYLEMIDPLDKAGAYAIQGAGGIIIEKISGCYYNVVGLPLALLDELLAHFDVQLL
jgi:septum formation protein